MTGNSIKILPLLLVLMLWTSPCVHAGAARAPTTSQVAGAQEFVDVMAKKTVALLRDDSLSKKQKRSQYRTLLFANFDMDTIGRFVLGTYWQASTPAQRKEYQKLFREMIASDWADRFEDYKGEKFEIRAGHKAEKVSDTLVSSVIIPSDKPDIDVTWRVRSRDGRYKIVDVNVEGVSLTVMQRSDFSSVIQSGGGNVEALLAALRRKIR